MDNVVIGILASGRGSNAEAILRAIQAQVISARAGVVISDRKGAPVLERAANYGLPAFCISPADYPSKQEQEMAILCCLQKHGVNLVLLAGYMRILGATFIKEYRHRIMNVHPSLLPAFPGKNAQAQALAYGVRVSGCTVHFVDEGVDTGPIILQGAVPVMANDKEEDLAARILKVEHELYVQAVSLYCQGQVEWQGNQVHILGEGEE